MGQDLVFKKIVKNLFSNESHLRVRPEQVPFVCENVQEFVRSWKDDNQVECFLIEVANVTVGFFAIDFSAERHKEYTLELDHFCVFRCFFIDERFQGRGYASMALAKLGDFLRAQYQGLRIVILTVNCKNRVAVSSYDNAGFKKLDDLYLGGSAGPQYVMAKTI